MLDLNELAQPRGFERSSARARWDRLRNLFRVQCDVG
jgi:hypothetical protein